MARAKRVLDDPLPDDRPPAHLVESLVSMGFREQDVERWPAEKIRHILDKARRDAANAVSKADGVAVRNDGATFPPPQPERQAVAAWIAMSLAKTDKYELVLAIEAAVRHLADDELLRLATHMIQRLKAVPPLPDSGNSLLGRTKTARARSEGAEPVEVEEGIPL